MTILKKSIGVLLLLTGALFSLATINTFVNGITESIAEIKKSGAVGIGYAVGSMIVIVLAAAITYFALKSGLKLLKDDPSGKNKKEGADKKTAYFPDEKLSGK